MDIKDLWDKLSVSTSLKIKRYLRILRRPFVRVRSDHSVDLYTSDETRDPAISSSGRINSDIKIFDIACVFAAICAFFSFIRAVFKIFD